MLYETIEGATDTGSIAAKVLPDGTPYSLRVSLLLVLPVLSKD